ncbi:MAG: MaoC/PaaZ C-terminal domain-containing protein [Pseudonocardiaceae bacterium]
MASRPVKRSSPALAPLWATGSVLEQWRLACGAWGRVWSAAALPLRSWADATLPLRPEFRSHAPGRSLDTLEVGDTASITRTFSQDDIDAFARISGDDNPAHVDEKWAGRSLFEGTVAHGMLTAGLISAVLGTELPGPGSVYLGQTLKFLAPVRPGDTLRASVTIREIDRDRNRVMLDTNVECDGTTVLVGEARVMAPTSRSEFG